MQHLLLKLIIACQALHLFFIKNITSKTKANLNTSISLNITNKLKKIRLYMKHVLGCIIN